MSTHYTTKEEWVRDNRQQLHTNYLDFIRETGSFLKWEDWINVEWEILTNKYID